jgi:hypothetical protein
MNKIRNHAVGASITAVTLVAVVALTGCGNTTDECDNDAQSMSLVTGRGGTSGGGGSRGGGGFSKPSVPKAPNMNKGPAKSGGSSSGGSSSGGSSSGGKAPKTKVDVDFDECEDQD